MTPLARGIRRPGAKINRGTFQLAGYIWIMISRLMGWNTVVALALGMGCAAPGSQITYDRFDKASSTYVNDTAGFAMVFDRTWRVVTDAESPGRLFALLPIPTGTEISLKAVTNGVGLWVETTRVPSTMALGELQPTIFQSYAEYFRHQRYLPRGLEKKNAHGIEYVEWVYQLRTPDRDDTFVEALFLRGGYAVRVRAKTTSEQFESTRGRIERLMGSLTAVDTAAGKVASATR
jgi:hypothetical protein